MWNSEARRCDLHAHSDASDGSLSPEALVRLAKEKDLSAIALTDHNTIAGLEAFTQAGAAMGICTVRGVELTSVYQQTEIHMLALFLPVESDAAVNACTRTFLARKAESNRACVDRLKRAGYDIDYDEIAAASGAVSLNRVHIAAALMAKGYIPNLQEGFKNLLHPARGYYIPPERIDALDAVELIRSWKAVPVWAHPALSLNHVRIEPFVQAAAERGLAGLETRYSSYTQADERLLDDIARRYALLPSGGSDFHGVNKPDIDLGCGRGRLYIPASYYEGLRAFSQHIKENAL